MVYSIQTGGWRGSRILSNNCAIVLHQGGQCRWGGGGKDGRVVHGSLEVDKYLVKAKLRVACSGGASRRVCGGGTSRLVNGERHPLAFRRYSHRKYCMVYDIQRRGRWGGRVLRNGRAIVLQWGMLCRWAVSIEQ